MECNLTGIKQGLNIDKKEFLQGPNFGYKGLIKIKHYKNNNNKLNII